jgi:hypothetical protein
MWNRPRIGLYAGPQGVRSYDLRLRRPLAAGRDLATTLAPLSGSRARLEVVLSDAYCRYLVMPRPEGIRNREELTAAVHNRFHAAFGDTPAWQLQHSGEPFERQDFVAGVDASRIEEVEAAALAAGLTVVSMRPHWLAWARHFRRNTRRGTHWIVVPDTDWLSLGYVVDGRCLQARAVRLGGANTSLLDLLARERALVDGVDSQAAICIAGEDLPDATVPSSATVTRSPWGALWGLKDVQP